MGHRSRAQALMQGLRTHLEYWKPRITKVALLDSLDFEVEEGGEFRVVARWKSKVDEGEHVIHFTRQKVFGPFLTSPRQRLAKRSCDFRDDLIRELMTARGLR